MGKLSLKKEDFCPKKGKENENWRKLQSDNFYSTAFKSCAGIVLTHDGSKALRCWKLILGWEIGWGCRGATSWCDIHLTFDFAVVNLNIKILAGLYLGICKV